MKYFIDTEFLEGPQRERLFGIPTVGLRWDKDDCLEIYKRYTPPTIDLISIGIVAEDGREYYAISKDFNLKEAWNRFQLEYRIVDSGIDKQNVKVYWLRENVLKPIFYELIGKDIEFHDFDSHFTYKSFKFLIDKYGKTNKEIAREIREFTEPTNRYYSLEGEKRFTHGSVAVGNPFKEEDIKKNNLIYHYPASNPKFYAYYADYDWVAFCWLFGNMMDLPKGFPMFAFDIQQQIEEYKIDKNQLLKEVPQVNCHNALADARWNKELHEFLNSI